MHPCRSFGGLTMPMVEVTSNEGIHRTRGPRHTVKVREDYIGDEQGLRFDDDGAPVMAVHTERPDGSNDTYVLAPVGTNSTER